MDHCSEKNKTKQIRWAVPRRRGKAKLKKADHDSNDITCAKSRPTHSGTTSALPTGGINTRTTISRAAKRKKADFSMEYEETQEYHQVAKKQSSSAILTEENKNKVNDFFQKDAKEFIKDNKKLRSKLVVTMHENKKSKILIEDLQLEVSILSKRNADLKTTNNELRSRLEVAMHENKIIRQSSMASPFTSLQSVSQSGISQAAASSARLNNTLSGVRRNRSEEPDFSSSTIVYIG